MENNFSINSTKSTLESDDEDKKSNKPQDFDENATEGHISKEKNIVSQLPFTKSNDKKSIDVVSEQVASNSDNLPENKRSKQHEFENYRKRGSDPQSGSDKEWNVFKGKKPVSERLSPGWQEECLIPKENEKPSSQPGTSTAESNKFNHDLLVVSPCPPKITPQTPQLLPQDNLETAEIDQFEDSGPTPSLQSNDNKLHAKKAIKKERFVSALVPTPGSHGPKIDPNRVNELDRFCNLNTKTFMNNYLRPQNEFKKNPFRDIPMAGTSGSSWKRMKKAKDKEKAVVQKKVPEKFTALDDAKSITNCIIKNSLNIIDVEDEIIGPHSELIQNLVDSTVKPEMQDTLRLIPAVENGDLENNNNENEGNRLAVNHIQSEDIVDENGASNDNDADFEPLLNDINDSPPNNDSIEAESDSSSIDEHQEHESVGAEPVVDNDTNVNELEADSVAQASREVLYDVNSEQDLLEDFDIPPQADTPFDAFGFGHSVLLVGVHPINSSGTRSEDQPTAGAVQTNPSSFPNWLLQILGSQAVPEEGTQVALGSHDEPHFYCQGDGLGVHPSVIAVEVDEADDADNDTTTTEESSSNNTADYAEVDPGPSDMFDMSSLPEESPATSVIEENTLRATDSVLSERTQNEDAVESSSCAMGGQALADENSIVNEVIRTAEEEVHRRSTLDGEKQENQHSPTSSNLTVEEQPSLPKLTQTNIMDDRGSEICPGAVLSALSSGSSTTAEYITSSESSGLSEQEVNGNFDPLLAANPESGQQHMIRNIARPNSIHEVKSASTSEKSEYFDL